MKTLTILTLSIILSINLEAQNDNDITSNRVRQTLSRGNVSTMASGMRTLPLTEGKTEGNYYLQDGMVPTNFVLLGDDVYEGYMAKYNIKGNFFAVEYDSAIKYLEGDLLKAFTYIDPEKDKRRIFINERVLPNTIELIKGFWELHHNGEKVKLLSKKKTEVIEANYNPALDVGNRNSRIKKINIYYLLENNEYKKIEKLKKKNLYIFGDKQDDMGTFIKQNKIDPESETALIQLVQYYDSLLSAS